MLVVDTLTLCASLESGRLALHLIDAQGRVAATTTTPARGGWSTSTPDAPRDTEPLARWITNPLSPYTKAAFAAFLSSSVENLRGDLLGPALAFVEGVLATPYDGPSVSVENDTFLITARSSQLRPTTQRSGAAPRPKTRSARIDVWI